MNDRNPQRDELNPDAPGKLQDALKALHARRLTVPPEVDAAVMKAARQHLQQAGSSAPHAVSARRPSRPTPTLW